MRRKDAYQHDQRHQQRKKLQFLLYSEAINSEQLIGFMEVLIKTSNGKSVFYP